MSTFRLIFTITVAIIVALLLVFLMFFEVQILEAEFTMLINDQEFQLLEIKRSIKPVAETVARIFQ